MSEETKPNPPQEDLEATQRKPPVRKAWTEPQVLTAIITGLVSVILAVLGIVPVLIRNMPTPPPPTPTATYTPAPPTSIAVVMVTDTSLPPSATPTLTFTPLEPTTPPLPPIATQTRTSVATEVSTTAAPLPTSEPTTSVPTVATATSRPLVVEASATFTMIPTTVTPPTPTFTLTPVPAKPDLRILYDEVSLTVVNVSGRTLSLEGVEFFSESGRWEAFSWGAAVHDRLPNNNCLRLRDLTARPRNPPSDCQTLFGLMVVGQGVLFWLETDSFEVRRNGDVIATCAIEAERCEVALSGQ